MGRTLGAVVAGYLTMFILVFITLTLAYVAMGAEGAFQPGSYGVSSLWLLASFALSFLAALAGGRVGRGQKPVSILAGLVFALGLTMAVPALLAPEEASTLERPVDMSSFEAMQKAQQPNRVSLTVPLVGVAGVLLGGRRS